uniref:Uncharacterized protein n=1 Tax=Panagrolaimus sp. PS1159 TaxID=55785 RepID=A0AC35FD96_9BILA
MPYADVRFIETDWEQTNEDFENHLTSLHNELAEERGITDGINKIIDEINHLNNDVPSVAKESLIDIQEKALPPLRTEMERLTKLDTDARRNRRIVARNNEPSLQDINNRLSELENATQQRIQDLDNLENEKRIFETRQQIDILSQQPDITEETFVQIHQQLSQLPENDPTVAQLQQQVEEVKAKNDSRNALKRKLNDNINANMDKLKNIQQNVMVVEEEQPESGKKRGKKSKTPKEPQIIGDTRDKQIENLRKAIDIIESDIVPSNNDIARKASEGGLDVTPLEAEEQKAKDLLDTLKSKLSEKEKEHEKIVEALNDSQSLNNFVNEVSVAEEQQPTDQNNLNAENAQATLDNLIKRANDLKEHLDKEPSDDVIQTFTNDERAQYDKNRDNANELLKKLLEKCNDLQKQLDNISQWKAKKSELDEQANAINETIQSLKDEFNTPQSLSSANDGLRRAEAIEPRIKEAQKQLRKTNDWLQKQLPGNNEVKEQLNELEGLLNNLSTTRENLINRLEKDIESEKKLIADQNALIDSINKLGEDAIAVHKSDDLDKKPAALAAIHEQLKPIEDKLQQLENRAQDANTSISHNETLNNIPLIRERLNNIAESLNEQEKDAADNLALAGISSNLNREISILRDDIDKAERIDNDPAATVDDLRKVVEILESSLPHVEQADILLQQIDPNNSNATKLLNKSKDELSQLRERLDTTRQAANDRANQLEQFNTDLDNIANDINNTLKAINDLRPTDPQVSIENVNELKQQNVLNGDKLKNKEDQLKDLEPLTQPSARLNALTQQQQSLDNQLNKLYDDIQNETAKRQELETFNNQLNKAEDDIANAERDIDATNDISLLEQINEQQLIPINELITSIDSLPIPNDEIKNRKKAIKKRSKAINDKLSKKLENARKQNDIISTINDELAKLENATQPITSKYENGEIKHPLAEAKEDCNALNKIIEGISPLNIDEISDKPTRDALSKRAEQLRSNVKSFTAPLNEDINTEEKLLQDYKNLLAKISDLGINVAALGETGIIDDEIRKSGDLVEQLRKLRKPANNIDNKMQQPLNHIEHSIKDEMLSPQLDNIQAQLDEKRKYLENRAKINTIAPQIELLTVNLQQNLDNYETSLPENLEEQQQAFNSLTEQKRKLEDYNENIPEGPEGDEIREKTNWNLSRLTDLLKKLGDAVGEKAAALAAFIASKRAIEEQLNTLHNDITAAESNIDNATPNNLQDRINALEAEEARINAIRSRLSDEQINRNNLDDDKQNELDELHKALDAAVERLQNARKNLTDELASAIASEQIQADTNHYYNDLADLIRQAHQTLADPTAIPISYHDLGQRINDKIQETNRVIQDANTSGNSTIIQPLNELIPQAQNAENDLATRYNLWLEFVKERDNANDQVDQARNVLNDFEANIDLRPLNVAENQLETLKVN